MIKKLGLSIRFYNPLFLDKREGFRLLGEAVQLMSDKIDELVEKNNELEAKLEALAPTYKEKI